MDTDLLMTQYNSKMLKLVNEYDIISGSRYCAGGDMQDQIHSHLSFFFNLLLKLILKTQIQDKRIFLCFKKIIK